MQNLLSDLKSALSPDPAFFEADDLLKNVIVERALKMDPALLALLLANNAIRKVFFTEVSGSLVFDKVAFQRFVSNKDFLPDSYTAFKNRIGLAHGDDYLKQSQNVVLAWPFKDCVLEGGMTKEDRGRQEVFWNETLAPDDISRLFEPKVMTNFQRWDADAVEVGTPKPVEKISMDDNLLIKGNNLLALHTLKERYAGKVKLIYIDPPYNTGNDGFRYNDRFNHASWLTFMKNRLEVAKELLSTDGAIFVNLDDGEAHYCKVLMDEVFGRDNFVANIVWQKKYAPANDAKWFSDDHDHLLCFAKSRDNWRPNSFPRSAKQRALYKNPDKDPRGDWKADNYISNKTRYERPNSWFPVIHPKTGEEIWPSETAVWRYSLEQHAKNVVEGNVWWGKDGGNKKPAFKRFISELRDGVTPQTIWKFEDAGHNQEARREMNNLGFAGQFQTPKPEKLLSRVISVSTNENDLVLDFFAGSGTTAAVASKMGRRWIGIEQMDYIDAVTSTRLKKVIEGEQGGISEAVDWHGGGSFVRADILTWNDRFIARIRDASSIEDLFIIRDDMLAIGYLRHDLNRDDLAGADLSEVPFEDAQRLLISCLDMNHLYVNIGDMADPTYGVSEDEQRLNMAFQELEA